MSAGVSFFTLAVLLPPLRRKEESEESPFHKAQHRVLSRPPVFSVSARTRPRSASTPVARSISSAICAVKSDS